MKGLFAASIPDGSGMASLNTIASDCGSAKPDVSVVIPVYNSEQILPELTRRLAAILPQVSNRYELVLVNDGSRDGSWEQISRLAADYPWIRGIGLMRNYGQHNALLCGVRAAAYPITIIMDDDLQHPPAEIPRLLAKLAEGYDVVYAAPQEGQHGFWRNTAARVTKLALQSVLGAETAGKVSPLPGVPHPAAGCLCHLSGLFCIDRRLIVLGHEPLLRHFGALRSAAAGKIAIHLSAAGHARAKHDDRF